MKLGVFRKKGHQQKGGEAGGGWKSSPGVMWKENGKEVQISLKQMALD